MNNIINVVMYLVICLGWVLFVFCSVYGVIKISFWISKKVEPPDGGIDSFAITFCILALCATVSLSLYSVLLLHLDMFLNCISLMNYR